MRLAAIALLTLTAMASLPWPVPPARGSQPLADIEQLDRARVSGDIRFQRRYMWTKLTALLQPASGGSEPAFLRWPGQSETFAPVSLPAQDPAGGEASIHRSGEAPLISFIHYNPTAYRHIRDHGLYRADELKRLRVAGASHSIPPFPRDAIVAMSAWWPISADGETPMPVWDPEGRHRLAGTNSYVSWPRLLSVVPGHVDGGRYSDISLSFAGRIADHPLQIGLDRFHHVAVTNAMAEAFAADPAATKVAQLVLGRPLRAGDFIALVGLHVMTAELPQGIWATWWWHDRPLEGPYAADRPAALAQPWQNYLMDVAFDGMLPREADGSPNICFNPWFDGGLGDSGYGNGLKANCISCHDRASYPLVDFTLVTRAPPDLARDQAYQAGQVRTGQIWSIARNARRISE